ncbi:hypothetical protein CTheo_1791 [Ceratobasidium theobromae]|uniref:Uncharacterized protein n=1 Tax=Ceratobasidium theobromae TaxID=1582974 RepID=A0A5N5QSS3_9AGAM|nr:hypothetical protein CTheo_1791 [Ceratobasidium theobromae]
MSPRPRQSTRKTSSTPPPTAHPLWSSLANSVSNPTLVEHSGYPIHTRPQQPRHYSDRFIHPPGHPMYSSEYSVSPTSSSLEGGSGSPTPKAALKMLSSVRRSFSSTIKKSIPSASFTVSTAEETAATQIRISDSEAARPPPTVQQIAAGLVTGLRHTSRPSAQRWSSSPRPVPTRSSLKKSPMSHTSSSSSTSLASTSLMSTLTGSTAATSVASSRRHRFSLKDAFFGRSTSVSPNPLTTATRKAVRFHVDRSPVVEQTPLPS